MCADEDLMEKTLTEAAQLLQKISRAAAMRRDWETRLAEEPEYNSRKKKCDEISKEATPEVTKEEPVPRKLEEEHIKSRTTLLTVKIRQPSHESTFGVGISFIPYPLVLTPVV
jgi:hypothetical protein